MPKDLANRLHINTLLVMLPYDMDKVAKIPSIQFEVDKEKQIYSFLDTHQQRKYYKLIADSDAPIPVNSAEHDARMKDAKYSHAHDAAAFVKVTPDGTPILDSNRKPQVTVTFPGMNQPDAADLGGDLLQAANDLMQTTAYNGAFFDKFIKQDLSPALAALRIKPSDVDVVAHSMGNKNAYEFAMRFKNEHVLNIDGWDEKDALLGAAIRNVLRVNHDNPLNEADFKAQVSQNVKFLSEKVIEVNKEGSEEVHSTQNYTAKGAGHLAGSYIGKNSADMLKSAKQPDINGAQKEATGARGMAAKIFDPKNGTEVAEAFFVQEMKTRMFDDKALSPQEAALLHQVQSELKGAGLQLETMQSAYKAMHGGKKPSVDVGIIR